MMSSYNYSKETLIDALAESMGQPNFSRQKYEDSKYDPNTGTLYCQDCIIRKNTIDSALEYMKAQKNRAETMAESDSGIRNIIMYYRTAIEAINLMVKEDKNIIH